MTKDTFDIAKEKDKSYKKYSIRNQEMFICPQNTNGHNYSSFLLPWLFPSPGVAGIVVGFPELQSLHFDAKVYILVST